MLKNINAFLGKSLNTSEEKNGKGTVKRVFKNKNGNTYYIISVNIGDGHTVDAKSTEYAKTSPALEVGTEVDVTYCTVGKHVCCDIKDDLLLTADDARDKKFIYIVCVGVMTVILFAIFVGFGRIF